MFLVTLLLEKCNYRDLAAVDDDGASDPYVTCVWAGQVSQHRPIVLTVALGIFFFLQHFSPI